MIRFLEEKDIEKVNELINDKNYVVNEYELKKIAKVFIKDNKIIGFISVSKYFERAELNYIFVKKEFRNNHIASILIEDILNTLNDIESIDLEVNEFNKPAINLYEKYGFKQIGIRKNYYNNEDALLMKKEIR